MVAKRALTRTKAKLKTMIKKVSPVSTTIVEGIAQSADAFPPLKSAAATVKFFNDRSQLMENNDYEANQLAQSSTIAIQALNQSAQPLEDIPHSLQQDRELLNLSHEVLREANRLVGHREDSLLRRVSRFFRADETNGTIARLRDSRDRAFREFHLKETLTTREELKDLSHRLKRTELLLKINVVFFH